MKVSTGLSSRTKEQGLIQKHQTGSPTPISSFKSLETRGCYCWIPFSPCKTQDWWKMFGSLSEVCSGWYWRAPEVRLFRLTFMVGDSNFSQPNQTFQLFIVCNSTATQHKLVGTASCLTLPTLPFQRFHSVPPKRLPVFSFPGSRIGCERTYKTPFGISVWLLFDVTLGKNVFYLRLLFLAPLSLFLCDSLTALRFPGCLWIVHPVR